MLEETALAPPPGHLLQGSTLLLDFDGTLVEIAERPDGVRVSARLSELIQRLIERLDGRIAVISGRPAGEVHRLLGPEPLTIVGSHGMEFYWADGRIEIFERPGALTEVIAAMNDIATRTPQLIVEDKPLGIALHFRQAPYAEAECVDLATHLAEAHGLHLQLGKMMVEVRAGGGDKGSAIRTLMREPKLAATLPLFMGDDLTDEPGFAAAAALGGAGILVGPHRDTAARFRLADVGATLDWLEIACEQLQ